MLIVLIMGDQHCQVVIASSDELQDTALEPPILCRVVVDLVSLTDPKLINFSKTLHLSIWYMKQIIQITQQFSFNICNSIKY